MPERRGGLKNCCNPIRVLSVIKNSQTGGTLRNNYHPLQDDGKEFPMWSFNRRGGSRTTRPVAIPGGG